MSTILFVDDRHAFRTVFAETLRFAGHMVLEAGTLEDAEHLVERQHGAIDLLIVEAVLTTTNGKQVLERLRSVYPKMHELFISDQSAGSLHEQGLLPKGAHFLRKPFDAEDLIGIVAKLARTTGRRTSHRSLRAGARRNS